MREWTPRGAALGEVVRARRRALGVSQEELASRCGLPRTLISDIERGLRADLLDDLPAELFDPERGKSSTHRSDS
jgi:transcriptional regulator with XRE-family HTH domain